MNIIGIVGRCETNNDKSTMCVYDNYRKAIIHFGGIPIMILPPQIVDYTNTKLSEIEALTEKEKDILVKQLELCSGIIMPGGTKIFEYDRFICDYCNKKNIPILGICLGMQIMCNYDNNNINNPVDNHYSLDDYTHSVSINKNSRLFEILKEDKIIVNSFHNYQVSNSGSYNISALCDGVIEAVEKKENLFNIGLQWHPEKNFLTDTNSQKIFLEFIKCSKSSFHE